jgi:dUTP pyrophosphatase
MNDQLPIKIKLSHPDAELPVYANEADGAVDLKAVSMELSEEFVEYNTGISINIPNGYVGLVYPRSSISNMKGLSLCNSVGVIDSGYSGEVKLRFNHKKDSKIYLPGDRVAQLMVIPRPNIYFKQVIDLPKSERGDGSFGSTGK